MSICKKPTQDECNEVGGTKKTKEVNKTAISGMLLQREREKFDLKHFLLPDMESTFL